MVAQGNGWTEDQTLTALTLALRGNAVQILETIPDSGRSLALLMEALEARYGEKHLEHVYRAQLRDRVQRPGEGLQQWAFEVERLVRRAYSSTPEGIETLLLQFFIDGIRDLEIRTAVQLGHHHSLKVALAHALEVEAVRQVQQPYRIHQEMRQDVIRRGPTCYECGKRGHLQIDCPKRKLWKSMTGTHMETQNLKVNSVRAVGRVPIDRWQNRTVIVPEVQDGNSFTIKGELNGSACNFIIDTGASRTIVRPELLPRMISWGRGQMGYRLQTATGQPISVLGESEVLLKMGDKTTMHPVIIASITSDCIIGLDYLRRHQCILDVAKGVVSFPDQKIEAVTYTSSEILDKTLCEQKVEKSRDANEYVKNSPDGKNVKKKKPKRKSNGNKNGQKKIGKETARRVEQVKKRIRNKSLQESENRREKLRQNTSPERKEYWKEFESDVRRITTDRSRNKSKESSHRPPGSLLWKQ